MKKCFNCGSLVAGDKDVCYKCLNKTIEDSIAQRRFKEENGNRTKKKISV